jgi:glycosyltransferase involved in cell wall biosynthesis
MHDKIRALLIAPYFDKSVPGECWCTFKWIEEISKRTEATVLTTHFRRWDPSRTPIPNVKVINWPHIKLSGPLARFDNEAKPHYIYFYIRCKIWLLKQRDLLKRFDIAHQINPVGMRYPSPLSNCGLPYIIGPQAGSLETPLPLRTTFEEKKWYRKLRNFDLYRIKHDPILRKSYARAERIIGVAPYVKEHLSSIPLKSFEVMAETGPLTIEESPRKFSDGNEPLRLLFVGRLINTKGITHAIRAVKILKKQQPVHFNILGVGDLESECRKLVKDLDLENVVNFHGRQPRSVVYEFYQKSDIFLFPSFREPSGTVVFEALGSGLPAVVCRYGGPGHVVDESCGVSVEPADPDTFTNRLAEAVLSIRPKSTLEGLSTGCLRRMREIASWDKRAERIIEIYRESISSKSSPPRSLTTN